MFLASIREQIHSELLILYASPSKELTATTGILRLSAIAFTVDIPILIPVKEPGPLSDAIKSILKAH